MNKPCTSPSMCEGRYCDSSYNDYLKAVTNNEEDYVKED